jgi:type II secretory pathway pseudopilin PulG
MKLQHRPATARISGQGGFALVETLIATAIIAGMLAAVFQVIQTGAQQSRSVEQRRLAILTAQSQLAAVGASENNRLGESRGVSNEISWRISITPRGRSRTSTARLEDVTVTTGIAGEERALFVLRTIRVAQ